MRYNTASMKKAALLVLTTLYLVLGASSIKAEDTVTVCTQYYGGGVVCGAHTPVDTGIADNIPLIGSLFLGSSGILAYLSKRKRG
jgi:hypothetical protein